MPGQQLAFGSLLTWWRFIRLDQPGRTGNVIWRSRIEVRTGTLSSPLRFGEQPLSLSCFHCGKRLRHGQVVFVRNCLQNGSEFLFGFAACPQHKSELLQQIDAICAKLDRSAQTINRQGGKTKKYIGTWQGNNLYPVVSAFGDLYSRRLQEGSVPPEPSQ